MPEVYAGPVQFDCIGIAASLGGPLALRTVLCELPDFFPVPVVAVQHRGARSDDRLADVLRRRCRLDVRPAVHGELLQPGVTVVPGANEIRIDRDGRLVSGPRHQPPTDADTLFVSMAAAFGARTLAVVLTGAMSDGAAGVRAVKRTGGRVLVQDPTTAAASGMPQAALATGCSDYSLPLETIGAAIVALTLAPGAASLLQVPLPHWADLRSAAG
jgi:two-component system chemotaxis response regulator CheB